MELFLLAHLILKDVILVHYGWVSHQSPLGVDPEQPSSRRSYANTLPSADASCGKTF